MGGLGTKMGTVDVEVSSQGGSKGVRGTKGGGVVKEV